MHRILTPVSLTAGALVLGACSAKVEHSHEHVHLDGLHAYIACKGLTNPSGVAVSSKDVLTVCDSGNGRVVTVVDGEITDYITDFPTEYWKVGKDGAPNRFKLGPLSALWVGDRLVVTNSGLADGADHVCIFDKSGKASDGAASNPIAKTSDDAADKGEGNFTGLSLSPDGKTVWVCGQGADAKSWLCSLDVASNKLEGFASADDNGIAINSPMDTLPWKDGQVLCLYSGAGGKEDGMLVAWSIETKKPVAQWKLPGLVDPMGMARKPNTDELLIVDNNWSLTEVQKGKLARVTLPDGGGDAKVEILTSELYGPVDCCFSKSGTLYVAVLGEEYDKDKGAVLAIDGL